MRVGKRKKAADAAAAAGAEDDMLLPGSSNNTEEKTAVIGREYLSISAQDENKLSELNLGTGKGDATNGLDPSRNIKDVNSNDPYLSPTEAKNIAASKLILDNKSKFLQDHPNSLIDPKNEGVEKNVLGDGAFGKVIEYVLLGKRTALKIPKSLENGEFSYDQINSHYKELEILSSLTSSDNIVKFEGVVERKINDATILCPVLEFCPGGSVEKGEKLASKKEKLNVIGGVLKGLKKMHDNNMVHNDIAGRNVLLAKLIKKFRAKLSDFGLAGKLEEGKCPMQGAMPLRTTAPEVIQTRESTKASDIWAVGCLIVEVMSGKEPYYGKDAFEAAALSSGFKLEFEDGKPKWGEQVSRVNPLNYHLTKIKGETKLDAEFRKQFTPRQFHLLRRCFNVNPDSRPTIDELIKEFPEKE